MYCQFDNYSYLGRCTEGHEPEPYSLQSLLNTSAFDTSTDAVIHQTARKKEKSKNQVHPENICGMCSILWETEEDQTKRFQKVLDESYWKKRLKNNLYRFLKIILSKKYSSVQEFFFFFLTTPTVYKWWNHNSLPFQRIKLFRNVDKGFKIDLLSN